MPTDVQKELAKNQSDLRGAETNMRELANLSPAEITMKAKQYYEPIVKPLIQEGGQRFSQFFSALPNELLKQPTSMGTISPEAALANAMRRTGALGGLYDQNLGLRDYYGTQSKELGQMAENAANTRYSRTADLYKNLFDKMQFTDNKMFRDKEFDYRKGVTASDQAFRDKDFGFRQQTANQQYGLQSKQFDYQKLSGDRQFDYQKMSGDRAYEQGLKEFLANEEFRKGQALTSKEQFDAELNFKKYTLEKQLEESAAGRAASASRSGGGGGSSSGYTSSVPDYSSLLRREEIPQSNPGSQYITPIAYTDQFVGPKPMGSITIPTGGSTVSAPTSVGAGDYKRGR